VTLAKLCRLRVSRVASGRSRRSWHVRYASNSDRVGASEQNNALYQ
jgi:Uri superfamily endonuclease